MGAVAVIHFYEWLAGKLLVRAAKARARRSNGLEDAHELRHLLAAVTAGNSSPCAGGRSCHLDAQTMGRLHDANFRQHPGYGWHNDGDECTGSDCGNPAHFEGLAG